MKEDKVHRTMYRLARTLGEAGIDYAIVGGMALAQHGLLRVTQDVDILMTPAGLRKLSDQAPALGFARAFEGARKTFVDIETRVRIEVLTSGEYPGDGKPKPVSFPDPHDAACEIDGVKVITLEKLIEIKLASGLSAPHRLRDLADVQDLIACLKLPAQFVQRLDASVRAAFEERWRAAQAAGSEEGR